MEVKSSTTEDLYVAIKNVLDNNNVPYKNLIGFAADHAAVMMGQFNGVQAKLRNLNPDIFVLEYVCHSFHTCASKVCEKLPKSVEEFVRNVSIYFSCSSKRTENFEWFQNLTESSHHKILKLSG